MLSASRRRGAGDGGRRGSQGGRDEVVGNFVSIVMVQLRIEPFRGRLELGKTDTLVADWSGHVGWLEERTMGCSKIGDESNFYTGTPIDASRNITRDIPRQSRDLT